MHFPRIRFFSSFFLKARGRHWNSREAMKMFLQNPFIFTNKFSLVTHSTQSGDTVCFYFLLNSVAFSVSFGLQTDVDSSGNAGHDLIWRRATRDKVVITREREAGHNCLLSVSDFCLASCVMPFISSVRGTFCPCCHRRFRLFRLPSPSPLPITRTTKATYQWHHSFKRVVPRYWALENWKVSAPSKQTPP